VGASLACALEPLGLKITVLEERPLNSDQQPSFDERTIALTYGSRQIFDAIGIWQAIEMQAGPFAESTSPIAVMPASPDSIGNKLEPTRWVMSCPPEC